MKFYSLILLTKHAQILCESFENGLNLMLDLDVVCMWLFQIFIMDLGLVNTEGVILLMFCFSQNVNGTVDLCAGRIIQTLGVRQNT